MNNKKLFDEANNLMPGGVNSPVRAFGSIGATPRFIKSASGCKLTDVEGKEYVDLMCSWGPLILGHSDVDVISAVREAAGRGLSYGACHEDEIKLAKLIQKHMPHVEKMRLVTSGTEAAMSTLRLARAATGRDKIIKFQGCYHGHADSFLIAAGSGALTHGHPSSPGVTEGSAKDTVLADYNDLDSVAKCFEKNEIAALFVEPIAGNMGVIAPAKNFLQGLRELCDKHGALLVFDEVITGFRVGLGGAAKMYNVTPDLTVLGKIIGGGMPIGAYGGRADLLEQMSPSGPVYQAGTLSGNPVACAAGIATLEILETTNPYPELERLSKILEDGTRENLKKYSSEYAINRVGSMSTLFFNIDKAETFADLENLDTEIFAKYHAEMLERGVYLPPSAYEACFISTAHSESDIEFILEAQRQAFGAIFS